MRPAVNLEAIQADIKSAKGSQTTGQIFSFVIAMLFAVSMIAFIILTPPPQSTESDCVPCENQTFETYKYNPVTDLLPVFAPVAILIFLFNAMPQIYFHIYLARRINRLSPNFIPRVTVTNVLSGFWPYLLTLIVVCLGLIIAIIFEPLAVLLLALTFAFTVFLPRVFYNQYQRFIKSAFDGGLTHVEKKLERWSGNLDLLTLKALFLMEEDRLYEAETLFRQLLERKWRWTLLNVPQMLSNLGICLMHQDRFDEALDLFDIARQINPQLGITYTGFAYCYLEQNQYLTETLELIKLALTYTPLDLSDTRTVQQAMAARAESILGKAADAQKTLNNVQWSMTNNHLRDSSLSEINRQIGCSSLALGDVIAARSYFRTAIKLDPSGLYGRLAKQALDSLST